MCMSERPSLADTVRVGLAPEVAAYNAALEAAVTAMQVHITALDARRGQNSTNYARPPSSDPSGTRRAPPAVKGARRPGGQPGHRGHVRVRQPVAQVDRGCDRSPPRVAAVVGRWPTHRPRTTRRMSAIR